MLKYLHNLLSPIVLSEPDLITVSAWHGHIPFAFWLVEVLRPKMLVELGTHTGCSYCAFCQAVQELHLPTSCYAVDTWEGDSQTEFYGEEVFQTLSTYHNARYSDFSRLVRSTFDQALEHFPEGSIDLLHIDGCHTYEAIKHDFTSWQPKLSNRAVVLFHDTNVREKDFGVWRFWEEIIPQYPAFEFLHYHGLGVLAVGQQIPEPVKWLIQIPTHTPEQIPWIRGYFGRLGKAIGLQEEITARDGIIQTLQGEIAAREGLVQVLQGEVAVRDDHIKTLQQSIASWQGHNQSLQDKLQSMQEKLQATQGQVQSLQHEIDVQDARIDLVYRSLSWKLTSPLRTVDRWLKIRQ
jgi:O-antigen biosynthesis protein